MKDGWIKVGASVPEIRVADTAYNTMQTVAMMNAAAKKGVKLLVFPELGLTGCTCGDLFLQTVLLDGAQKALTEVAAASRDLNLIAVVGLPYCHHGKVYNAAAVVYEGEILGIVPKCVLTQAERRFFVAGNPNVEPEGTECANRLVTFGVKQLFVCDDLPEFTFACEIGEDMTAAAAPGVAHTAAGALIIAHLNAQCALVGKAEWRRKNIEVQSGRLCCAYVSAEAGNGESTTDYVFAGQNLIVENGSLLAESTHFSNTLLVSDIDVFQLAYERRRNPLFEARGASEYHKQPFFMPITENLLYRVYAKNPFVPEDAKERMLRCEEVLSMQSAGLQKRIQHTHAKSVVVGISGGLDSCLALLVMVHAMDALGRDRKDVVAITMPCFGTTARTRGNAELMCEYLGVTFRTIDIKASVQQHFIDIGHDYDNQDVVFENSQARERTQILMDVANACGGMVVGTGDLSELALGWATYNGDHMSMYAVNASVPKTLIRHVVRYYADTCGNEKLAGVLADILDTPVSPELLPPKDGKIAQVTEDLVGPYELHDFFLYGLARRGYEPSKLYRLAKAVWGDVYDDETIRYWLSTFLRRFFNQQFKRSCLADGVKVGTVGLSPRGDLVMPSDAVSALWSL